MYIRLKMDSCSIIIAYFRVTVIVFSGGWKIMCVATIVDVSIDLIFGG